MVNRLKFTPAEITEIKKSALIGHKEWDNNKALNQIKRKIKDFAVTKTNERCCYCGRNIRGEFRMVLDIEHVIPKSLCVKYMFTMKNLSVSCKRCNMSIKKDDLGFLNTSIKDASKSFKSKHYKFIHPNLDNFDAHLLLYVQQVGKNIITIYKVVNGSPKGTFTYNYFQLNALEKNSLDQGQGGRARPEINNPKYRIMFNEINLNIAQD